MIDWTKRPPEIYTRFPVTTLFTGKQRRIAVSCLRRERTIYVDWVAYNRRQNGP